MSNGTISKVKTPDGSVFDIKDLSARTAVQQKQDAVTAVGILKGTGSSVLSATPGTDY